VGTWDASLLGIFVVQVLIWMFATHEMPARFIVPAIVPMVLLGGGFLSMLSRVQRNPLRPNAAPPASGGAWGLAPVVVLLAIAVLVNLVTVHGNYVRAHSFRVGAIGQRGEDLTVPARINMLMPENAKATFPADARFLMVGDVPFYFPDGSLYATAFDRSPLLELAQGATPQKSMDRLRERHIDYIWVAWSDLFRLSRSYGIALELSEPIYKCLAAGQQPALPQIEQFKPLGLVEVYSSKLPADDRRAFRLLTPDGKTIIWPHTTIYALPWATVKQWPTSQAASVPTTQNTK